MRILTKPALPLIHVAAMMVANSKGWIRSGKHDNNERTDSRPNPVCFSHGRFPFSKKISVCDLAFHNISDFGNGNFVQNKSPGNTVEPPLFS